MDVGRGIKIVEILNSLKKEKLVKRIGFSIYDPYKVKRIIDNYDFDVLQCPYNLFDKRLIDSGLSRLLRIRKIKIHLRSIFLQGLLLKNKKNIPIQFKNNYKIINYYKWLNKNNFSDLKVCLSELNKIEYEKIVIGINDASQLKEIIDLKNIPIMQQEILKQKI